VDKTKPGRTVRYAIRKATEEEHNVLSCMRTGRMYNHENFNWSPDFLDGKTKPFTKKYDDLIKQLPVIIKSKETYKPNAMNMRDHCL
jgi:hypothetical protein